MKTALLLAPRWAPLAQRRPGRRRRPAPGTRVLLEPGFTGDRDEDPDRDHLAPDYQIRGEHCDGFDAELVVLPARFCLPLPDGLDPVATAAAPLTFLTAWGMLHGRARIAAGETVLVLGAGSGVGSAAIAHSAVKTPYAVREGIVALLEPFIDTIVVCTMTALVIVITGAYDPATADGLYAPYLDNANGAGLTSAAFGSQISWFPYILSVAVVLFAFSTMISWSYYGERCFVWLFGDGASLLYKAMFLVFVFLGSIITATQVLEFGDLMIIGMAFPNVLGVFLLSGKVKSAFQDYWGKLQSGEIRPYDPNQETGKTA